MASSIYKKFKQALANPAGADHAIDLVAGTITAALVHVGVGHYQVDIDNDEFLNNISGGDIIATEVITSRSVVAGILNGDPTVLATVTGGPVGAIVVYEDTGDGSTSYLIAYIDGVTGLPATFAGGNVTITWDTGANKIFVL